MDSSDAVEAQASKWDDPRISNALMIATFVLGGVGIALGIYGLTDGGAVKGLHYAVPLVVGAAGVLSLVRHSVFHTSDAIRMGVAAGEPYFQIETGFANGAMGIVALLAFFWNWGVGAEVAVTLSYTVYLALAGVFVALRARTRGFDAGIAIRLGFWVLQVGFLFYLSIAAAASGNLI